MYSDCYLIASYGQNTLWKALLRQMVLLITLKYIILPVQSYPVGGLYQLNSKELVYIYFSFLNPIIKYPCFTCNLPKICLLKYTSPQKRKQFKPTYDIIFKVNI